MRPKLIARMTVRLPEELALDIMAAARRRSCSANEVFLSALENEFARLGMYRLHYYDHIRPILAKWGETVADTCLTKENRAQ